MNWIKDLNKAIDYIEAHLLTELTCEDVAKHIYISNYQFQRAFSLLTGMTMYEYVRNRRLSLAGQELIMSKLKIIDVALKYGYDTPESFTKAFTRFHGIAPSQAKIAGSNLKSFNRLLIKIKLEGGIPMEYRIEQKESFEVVAKTKTFTLDTSEQEIPKFWSQYFADGSFKQVPGALGICEETKTGGNEFRYGIGCFYEQGSEIPTGFEILSVPAYTWAVFKCVGKVPFAIQDTWERIYREWLPQSDYELVSDYDFEYYTDGDTESDDYVSEIWLPVQKK